MTDMINFIFKETIKLVQITKHEAAELRKAIPDVFITQTRYKYLVEESSHVLKTLGKIRSNENVVYEYPFSKDSPVDISVISKEFSGQEVAVSIAQNTNLA
jgi:hypothetical protein